MAEIVNLRLARKRRDRAEAQVLAAQNRASFGAPKHVTEAVGAARKADARRLDGHLLKKGDDVRE